MRSAGEEQRDTKTQELADTDSALAQAKQDLEDTRNSLSADQKFLMNLKETCQMTDAEWDGQSYTIDPRSERVYPRRRFLLAIESNHYAPGISWIP